MSDAPYGWSAKNPLGFTTLLVGAQPGTGFTNVVELATQADYDAAMGAMLSSAFTAPAVPQTISRRQFFQQLAVQSVITQAEALAAVQTGAIPAAMQALVSALPTEQQFGAQMLISGATVFNRTDGLVAQLGAAEGWTAPQIDALWTAASAL